VARNDIVIDAPPAVVFETLMDADAYAQWIVGARQVRSTDRAWPRPGTRFHHRVGIGPLTLADSTKLISTDPNRSIVLEVRARPLGRARVKFDLRSKSRGRRTKVVMTERTTSGIWSLVPNPVERVLIHARNAASLRRLRRVVASRAGAGQVSRSGQ
jgi:uncharacterized protein YndB with AHSA1/START domain